MKIKFTYTAPSYSQTFVGYPPLSSSHDHRDTKQSIGHQALMTQIAVVS